LTDSRETQTVAGIVSGFRVVNGMRGKQGIFVLDDTSARVEASASEAVINTYRDLLQEDELVIVAGRLQPGRNGFEARFIVQQVWDLPTARSRFGKYLYLAVGEKVPDVAALLRAHPCRPETSEHGETLHHGLKVRLGVRCQGPHGAATAELQLGEAHRTYPSDAALLAWSDQAGEGGATIVYD
ncbi:MAG: DNA polymerase III subunit alpha, partial [Simplicispira sp.]|nr:DNA polymerase III subunit alpha [Simplicispira sp.]